jgi:N-acyl homoserine lactone hydrolase
VLFTGDAAKNRAELLSGNVDASLDVAASRVALKTIWSLWREAHGTIVVPGHDLAMQLDGRGRPQYLGKRQAAISAWFGEDLENTTLIDLDSAHELA